MSADQRSFWERKIQRMGKWCGVRHMRNQGVSFEVAHEFMLGYPPRLK